MAFRHGKFAEIKVATHALSAYCDVADLDINVTTADTTTFGSSWKSALTGLADGKVALAGVYDPTASTGPAAVLTALIGADPFAVEVYPGGNITGQAKRTFNAILTSYKEGAKVNDKVTFSADLMITGAVTFDTVS